MHCGLVFVWLCILEPWVGPLWVDSSLTPGRMHFDAQKSASGSAANAACHGLPRVDAARPRPQQGRAAEDADRHPALLGGGDHQQGRRGGAPSETPQAQLRRATCTGTFIAAQDGFFGWGTGPGHCWKAVACDFLFPFPAGWILS